MTERCDLVQWIGRLTGTVLCCLVTAQAASGQSGADVGERNGPAPTRAVYWKDGDHTMVGTEAGKGFASAIEVFVFSADKKTARPVGGMALTIKDCPVPMVMYSMSSALSGRSCGRYANLILDYSHLPKPTESRLIARQLSSDGTSCGSMELVPHGATELFVSPDYVVYRGSSREIVANGPFVRGEFRCANGEVVVSRNEDLPTRLTPSDGRAVIEFQSTKNTDDVVLWQIEREGRVVRSGSFGFPMHGAEPGLVRYLISETDGESRRPE